MKSTSKEVIDELSKIFNATPKEIKGFMTPKKKAQDLVETFWTEVRDYKLTDPSMSKTQAKECALIAVNEILTNRERIKGIDKLYWQQVKQEIEKL